MELRTAGWILGDMRAVEANAGSSASRRRSTGSRRGEARRRELLDRVTEDLAVNGLVDFSLRRAARAAGTTHKVLLYYFDGAEDLLGRRSSSFGTADPSRSRGGAGAPAAGRSADAGARDLAGA